jgi:hypothetical protein
MRISILLALALVAAGALASCADLQMRRDSEDARCAAGGGCVTVTRKQLERALNDAVEAGAQAALQVVQEQGGCIRRQGFSI